MGTHILSLNPIYCKLLALTFLLLANQAPVGESAGHGRGSWQLLLNNTGVVAMHMILTHRNTVVMFDQTTVGPSGYRLRRRFDGGEQCTPLPEDMNDPACYAHSVEYDIGRNEVRALDIITDTWCSSGSMLGNGTLIQTGGYASGAKRIRYFEPCKNRRCDWTEGGESLSDERWYSANLKLPGRKEQVIVMGGRNAFTYEFVPRTLPGETSFYMDFLESTLERDHGDNNLYPMIHLSIDGNLFVFANRDSILFNYRRNKVVKTFPRIPGEASRSHPSSGSSVILPLDHAEGFGKVEVMVCGGGGDGAYEASKNGRFLEGMSSCGRMVITGDNHRWRMEEMPGPRIMSNMIILPTGHVLFINGAKKGCAGWNSASDPALQPYLYKPDESLGNRFSIMRSTMIARMYHSSAVLLPDGRVLVAGSNPNSKYAFEDVPHPTEMRLQAFTPSHMEERFDKVRPKNVSIVYTEKDVNANMSDGVGNGGEFEVRFLLPEKMGLGNELAFTAYVPPFNTHALSMNQRMLILRCTNVTTSGGGWQRATVEVPSSPNVAPSGYYLLSVVNKGIPSESRWVRFVHA